MAQQAAVLVHITLVQVRAEKKAKNFKHVLIIQTHQLGDRYDKVAIQRDRLIDRRLTTAAAAKKDYAASHRYNSSISRRCS